MDEAHLIGVRDPHGFRPLCLGRLDNGWVLASETPALDIVGAHFVRELEPGEIVIIDADRVCARCGRSPKPRSSPSSASSSSSTSPGPTASSTARTCTAPASAWARQLARQAPVAADMVMGVPESGIPAAEGYARAERHPLRRRGW